MRVSRARCTQTRCLIVNVTFMVSLVSIYFLTQKKTENGLYFVGKISPYSRHFAHLTKTPPVNQRSQISRRDLKMFNSVKENRSKETIDKLSKKSIGLNTPLVTVFTTWVPSGEKDFVYKNTLSVWASLKPYIQPVVFTNISDISKRAKAAGWAVIPPVRKTCGGVPILKEMYLTVSRSFKSAFYCYANADILLNKGFVQTVIAILEKFRSDKSPILLVGKRIDVLMDKGSDQLVRDATKIDALSKSGNLSWGYAVDYFVSNKKFPWKLVPDLVIGRPVYDNWLVSFARKQNVTLIDGTATVTALHQITRKRNIDRHMCNQQLLLDKKLMRRMPISQGQIECTPLVTRYSYENEIVILPRMKLLKECKIWQ